jgi:hypothetical protein
MVTGTTEWDYGSLPRRASLNRTSPGFWHRSNRRSGDLRWWHVLVALLAFWFLLELSSSVAGWPGVTALVILVGVAILARNRLPWMTTAIERLLGLLVFIQICAFAVSWAGSVGILRPWVVTTLWVISGILFLAWFYAVFKRRRRNGHTPAITETKGYEKD